ncbi:MAG: hypothetical protein JSS72_08040 [Armatimonadetes bacterium]|nr:hypothetical protein [Armatimonadota bacterium]
MSHGPKRDPNLLAKMGYENEEVDFVRPVVIALALFTVFTILSGVCVGILWMFNHDFFSGKMNVARTQFQANTPMLQSNITTKTDIADLRRAEDHALSHAGAIDPKKGIYRIPVDQAMKETLEKGIPEVGQNWIPAPQTKPGGPAGGR